MTPTISIKLPTSGVNLPRVPRIVVAATLACWSMVCVGQAAEPPPDPAYVQLLRNIEVDALGLTSPAGLAYLAQTDALVVLEAPSTNSTPTSLTSLHRISLTGEPLQAVSIPANVDEPANMAFDAASRQLLVLTASGDRLLGVETGPFGDLLPSSVRTTDIGSLALGDARGMTSDPVSGLIFVLDAAVPRVVVLQAAPSPGLGLALYSEIDLSRTGLQTLRGIAFDPASGHLHIMNPAAQELYEVDELGLVIVTRDVSQLGLDQAGGMVFAPSGDRTDDPLRTSLYVALPGLATGGGSIAELALDQVSVTRMGVAVATLQQTLAAPLAAEAATLAQSIDTSAFVPPSPDPAGIVHLPQFGTLLISDSEVNEMVAPDFAPLFTGVNLFEIDPSSIDPLGILVDTLATTSYSIEPTGLALNPSNLHLFVSDDDKQEIYEVDPGPDGLYDTADDTVTSFDTNVFGSGDPEGVTFDFWRDILFIVDGINAEVYGVSWGPNGVFDGVPPRGDDEVFSFDTALLGITDPEGVAFSPVSGNLIVIGRPNEVLVETTTDGLALRTIDISAAPTVRVGGISYAPSSVDPEKWNIYIADRAVDNNTDPNENDGMVHELSVAHLSPGNLPPAVDAGADSTIALGADPTLVGSVSDDGLPNPPGAVTTAWRQVSGPRTVVFDDATAATTTARGFSALGSYLLRLTADDGELTPSDDIVIAVAPSAGQTVIQAQVATGTDDAEEDPLGFIALGSADLDLVHDVTLAGIDEQVVGMRFVGVDIPRGANIIDALVQFQADEATSEPASLTIRGEDSDNAEAFMSSRFNISSRSVTSAAILWTPPAWNTIGEAGPNQQAFGLAPIVQQIVDRPGWSSGNAMVLIVTGTGAGTGTRVAEAFEGVPAGAASLHVVYAIDTVPPVQVVNTGSTVAEGGSDPILATELRYDDAQQPAASVTYTVTGGLANGQLEIAGAAVTSFTQADINAGAVVYVHDGSNTVSDGFTFDVGDGQGNTLVGEIFALTVTPVNDDPIMTVAQVAASSDDAEEVPSGSVILDSSDLEFVHDRGVDQVVGMRFVMVDIPQGATIHNAFVQFQVDEPTSVATSLTIRGEDSDHAETFMSTTANISSRPLTSAAVQWTPPAWGTVGEAGPNQQTSVLTPIVQQIVDRPGWSSGNALALIVTGTGARVAESYDGSPTGAARLHVTYSIETIFDNQPPVQVVNTGSSVGEGGSDPILASELRYDDALQEATAVAYTVTGVPVNGRLEFVGAAGVAITNFTQADINAGRVLYLHDGSNTVSDAFVFNVGDGQGNNLVAQSFAITVTAIDNDPPVLVANAGSTVAAGGSDAILTSELRYDDADQPATSVAYTLTAAPANGQIELTSAPGTAVTHFTQADIDTGLVVYVHDGSNTTSDGFDFDVDDGVGNSLVGERFAFIITAPGGLAIREFRIAASTDDAEERVSGAVSRTSSDLELVFDQGGDQTVGMRFIGVDIPRGASIANAYVQFQVDEVNTGATDLSIQGEASDNAATFNSTTFGISGRPTTTASVAWSPRPWNIVGAAGPDQQSAVIASVIQEIVNRPGWASGNALAIIVTGSGERTAESFDGDRSAAALLHVEFHVGQAPPTVDAGPDQSITLPADAILDATVSDDGLPNPPGAVTTSWSAVSGPGSVTFANPGAVDTSASFSTPGTYVLRLSASDNELTASNDVSIEVVGLGGEFTKEFRVAASSDDAEETSSGSVSRTSSDLELVFDRGGDQTVGMRFIGVDIPAGATISNAYVQFQTDEVNTVATDLTIQGEAADDAATFVSTTAGISGRPRTTASVAWSPAPWNLVGEAGPDQQTPAIASVIQEIVDRPGWVSGNALAIIVTGSGERTAEAYDGNATAAPLLHVEYTP